MNKLDKYLILHISTFVFNKFYSSNSQALQIALVDKYLNKCKKTKGYIPILGNNIIKGIINFLN